MALRKVDIVGWQSEAFVQAGKEFGIRAIPHVRVYGKHGEFLGPPGPDLHLIEEAVRRGLNQ